MQLAVAVGIGTLINNTLTTGLSFWFASKTFDNYDKDGSRVGLVASIRGTGSRFGLVAESGIDVLWIPHGNKKGIYAYLGGDVGTNPISFFKKHRGLQGASFSFGLVFGISDPNLYSGSAVTATWPNGTKLRLPDLADEIYMFFGF